MKKTRCLIVVLLMILGLISLGRDSAPTSAATGITMKAMVRSSRTPLWQSINISPGAPPPMTYSNGLFPGDNFELLVMALGAQTELQNEFFSSRLSNFFLEKLRDQSRTVIFGIATSSGQLNGQYYKSVLYRDPGNNPMPMNTRLRGTIVMTSGKKYYCDSMLR